MDLKNKAKVIINSYSHKQSYSKTYDYFNWALKADDYDIIEMRNLLMYKIHKIKNDTDLNTLDIDSDNKNDYAKLLDTKKNCVKKVFKNDDPKYESNNQILEEKKNYNNISNENISDCFKWLQKIDWKDKDEHIMRKSRVSSYGYNLRNIYQTLLYLSDMLYAPIRAITGAVDIMTEEEKYNFLFHVISKGNDMFYNLLLDPEFCLYMLDVYQPLYTYLRELL